MFHVGKFSKRPLHFYLLEDPVEVVARDLLLLLLVNDFAIPIRQRANIFLEIFGNMKVQRRTSRYIDKLGGDLKALLNGNKIDGGHNHLKNFIDFSFLKYRERDLLEESFKSYSMSATFDMDSNLDRRYRSLYEERFDSRKALSDWDYHYTIK